jgi:hypothetical protein
MSADHLPHIYELLGPSAYDFVTDISVSARHVVRIGGSSGTIRAGHSHLSTVIRYSYVLRCAFDEPNRVILSKPP